MSRGWFFLWAAAWAAACTAEPPEVMEPGGGDPVELPEYADVVLAYTEGNQVVSCAELLAPCDEQQVDACGRDEVLGPPDGRTLTLDPGEIVEVGFRCGAIRLEFQIWADVPADGSAVIEVSLDGSSYLSIERLVQSDQVFSLVRHPLHVVRYVRISNTSSVSIDVDAIESLL
jgi:hypothetical protein